MDLTKIDLQNERVIGVILIVLGVITSLTILPFFGLGFTIWGTYLLIQK